MFLIIVVALVWPQAVPWRAVGRAEAEQDIAAGTMRWKIYGHMAGFTEEDRVARVNLRDRLGLELEVVAQCVIARELEARAEGYNDRIQEEVEARYGVGAIDEVWADSVRETQPELVAHNWMMRVVMGGLLVFLVANRRVFLSARASAAGPRGPR